MIKLSNGHSFEYVVASGALAFDGLGWPWEKPLVAIGFIKPELFTVFIKSLTRQPRKGNLRWWKPWECVRPIKGGAVNKVGLTNLGVEWWCKRVGPKIDYKKYSIAGSIFGEEHDLVEMAEMLNHFNLVALEVNVSCPNTGHAMDAVEKVINGVREVKRISCHPIIIKVSADQNCLAIARGLEGIAEAISLNSVPWKTAFSNGEKTPLSKLEKRVGGGGGGVSGRPAQKCNWEAVSNLSIRGPLPVIGPSVMEFDDMEKVKRLGARAVSFGAVHLPTSMWQPWTALTNPCKPTQFVEREKYANSR